MIKRFAILACVFIFSVSHGSIEKRILFEITNGYTDSVSVSMLCRNIRKDHVDSINGKIYVAGIGDGPEKYIARSIAYDNASRQIHGGICDTVVNETCVYDTVLSRWYCLIILKRKIILDKNKFVFKILCDDE